MRVMRILTRPNVGGPTVQAVALWHAHRALGITTLLCVGRCGPDEPAIDLSAAGIPRLDPARVAAIGGDGDAPDRGAGRDSPANGPGGGPAGGFVELPRLGRRWLAGRDGRVRDELVGLMRAFRPRIVHTHTSVAGWLGRRAARLAAVPVVAHTFHGHVLRDYFDPLRTWLLRRLEARLARQTDLLFAVSPSCADELAELGVAARSRFQVVPPAVPAAAAASKGHDRAAARRLLGLGSDQLVVCCVGRLVPIKRVADFVRAIAMVPGARGQVLGDGPLRPSLARLPEAGVVDFVGSRPDATALLAAYDALVLPSVREGCPLVAVEAFAAGVPVVGYDVPGVRDVLGAWGGGLLVPVAAGPAGLAAALRRLREDDDLRRECVDRGRAGLSRFQPAHVAEALLAAYRGAQAAGGIAAGD